jgi:putative hydrolase of the HAD superfamily
MLKAVTFDLGDTLIDYGPMSYRAMMRTGAARAWEYLATLDGLGPLPLRARFARRLCGAARRTWYRSKLLIQDRNVEQAMAARLARMGLKLDAERRRELVRRFFTGLTEKTQAMPGAAEVLAHVLSRGLAVALVSNTVLPPWLLDESLGAVGLLEFLPRRFYSCDLGCKKPQRRIFRRALEALGVTEPRAALHVGDRYLTDVWGARRAGLRTCLKVGHRSYPLPPVRPDFRIRQLSELPPILDRLAAEA